MAALSTKLHASGQRFLQRRMQHALVRGDVRMRDDPLRAQNLSLVGGGGLAVIIVAACAVLAFVRPPSELGTAPIVAVRDSGALYVRTGDIVHPVLNLASARLIAGTPANPESVSAAAINNARRGPLVGIPGAPAEISAPLSEDESGWAVCDDGAATVVAGNINGDRENRGVLVTARSESAATTYLLYDGRRARVDLRNRGVVRALDLEGIAPRPVSRVLLEALPEAPPITAPRIPGMGSASPLPRFPVGSVIRIERAAGQEYYVVLAQGMQRIGRVTADLIRLTYPQRERDIATLVPEAIAAVPIVDALPVSSFPERAGSSGAPVVCAQWRPGPQGANSAVLVRDSISGIRTQALAQADGDGPAVDAVAIAPGRSAYVRSVGVDGDGAPNGALYLISDAGVVFGLRDEATARDLGLSAAPVPAPWPVLARLPRGPELSKEAASVARDAVG